MRGTPLWMSAKRRAPDSSSLRIKGVQRSAKTSAASATGQNWPYPFMEYRMNALLPHRKSNFRTTCSFTFARQEEMFEGLVRNPPPQFCAESGRVAIVHPTVDSGVENISERLTEAVVGPDRLE